MYEKILLPVDDLNSAGLAFSNAKSIAGSTGAEVVLLHIVSKEPVIMTDDQMGGATATAMAMEISEEEEAAHVLDETAKYETVANDLSGSGVKFSSQIVVGNAHDEIVRAVTDRDIDLVIISTHGRRGMARTLLGSVADEVMKDVEVPVMVVRRT